MLAKCICMMMKAKALKCSRLNMCFSTANKIEESNIKAVEIKGQPITYSVNLGNIKGTKHHDGGKYLIMYTCKVCSNKSARAFSKDAYHNGVVIIRCEHCKNYHLIADNLKWFNDHKMNIEDIMKQEGMKVHKIMTDECIEILKKEEDKDI